MIDNAYLLLLGNELHTTAEALVFVALPVEAYSYCNVLQEERGSLLVLRYEIE